jgi:hypothetical protein
MIPVVLRLLRASNGSNVGIAVFAIRLQLTADGILGVGRAVSREEGVTWAELTGLRASGILEGG